MERKFEGGNTTVRDQGILRVASETFMANLPVLVCGFVVGAVLVREILLG